MNYVFMKVIRMLTVQFLVKPNLNVKRHHNGMKHFMMESLSIQK